MIRVAVIDDEPLARSGVKMCIRDSVYIDTNNRQAARIETMSLVTATRVLHEGAGCGDNNVGLSNDQRHDSTHRSSCPMTAKVTSHPAACKQLLTPIFRSR